MSFRHLVNMFLPNGTIFLPIARFDVAMFHLQIPHKAASSGLCYGSVICVNCVKIFEINPQNSVLIIPGRSRKGREKSALCHPPHPTPYPCSET